MIRAVIFDIDGTLVDSVDAHAASWQIALDEFGHTVSFADVRYQIGKGGDQLLKVFLTTDQIREQGEALEAASKECFMRDFMRSVRGFPKVRELFKKLRDDGKQIVLASSASAEELKSYKEKAGIVDLLDEETSKDEVSKSKPHADIFETAFSKLHDVDKAETLIIGDSPWDALAAGRAGIRCIAVLCGGFSKEDLPNAGFESAWDDPADLLSHYEQIFGSSHVESVR